MVVKYCKMPGNDPGKDFVCVSCIKGLSPVLSQKCSRAISITNRNLLFTTRTSICPILLKVAQGLQWDILYFPGEGWWRGWKGRGRMLSLGITALWEWLRSMLTESSEQQMVFQAAQATSKAIKSSKLSTHFDPVRAFTVVWHLRI